MEFILDGDDIGLTEGPNEVDEWDCRIIETKLPKWKKYRRLTPSQIEVLRAAYIFNTYPDHEERLELAEKTGLDVEKVKNWFQNKRTQVKAFEKRDENSVLAKENDELRIENISLKKAMAKMEFILDGDDIGLNEGPNEVDELDCRIIETKLPKRKKNRRLTPSQIEVLKAAYNNNPHPHYQERLELAKKIGLDVKTVKFWFNNKRSHVKVSTKRNENSVLFQENNNLRIENNLLNKAMVCINCGHRKMSSNAVQARHDDDAHLNKSMLMELALAGMDELMRLAQTGSPLWIQSSDRTRESLNLEEYEKTFMSPCVGEKLSCFETEATRATATVMINGKALVETLMDVNRWKEMFPWNIRSASILDVISPPTNQNQDTTLLLMQAEFQILSPFVPVRKTKLIRFCKQQVKGLWAVVDVCVDALFREKTSNRVISCRRLPSGCIVRDMPNGFSKVTWIEHTEYDENIMHNLYRPLIRSGMAFGAQKWIANLQRQCVIMSSIALSSEHHLDPALVIKSNIIKLAQRMTSSFCVGVCFAEHKWEVVHDSDNTKMMITRDQVPSRVILSATSTVRMPVSPNHLTEFLQNHTCRCYWDVMSRDVSMEQCMLIPTGQPDDLGNYVRLFRNIVVPTSEKNHNSTLMLQEICTDASGSILAYAAVEGAAVMNIGGHSSEMAILPSGFVIVPDCFPDSNRSLLTLGFQMFIDDLTAAQLTEESVDTVKTLIEETIQGIKAGLQCD